MNGNTKKVVGWSAATIIPLALTTFILFEKVGKAVEPVVTTVIRAEVKELKEDIGSLATDSRITEFQDDLENFDGKILALARSEDQKDKMIRDDMHKMELRILNKIDESRQETVRLLVAALNKKQGALP